MIITILITFISLIGLIVLHELGHFVLAKKFGVKVEEFGIGYPPRLIGKKIGETVYSLNLLPFGAFVKIYGEDHPPSAPEKETDISRNFSKKPIWQRSLIVMGGVVSFWLISFILLSIVMALGAPITVGDEADDNLKNPKIQILGIAPDSPAQIVGLRVGDTIRKFKVESLFSGEQTEFAIQKVKEVQELTEKYKGEKVVLTIERGKEVFEVSLIPRISPPEGEGPMGINLVRTAIKSYPWYQAPWQGILRTFDLTITVIQGWASALANIVRGLPSGAQLMGPVGIFSLFTQVSQLGLIYFLQFIAVISIFFALFNILPIPALDGGKLLFLGIEAIRKKPISPKIEQNITAVFFTLLVGLMIWVTIKDIIRIF